MIELDGAQGEGGGQILRTSLALSLITGRAFHLSNVRAGRAKPGLQPQHLMSVQAAAAIGRATTRGAARGSTDLVFEPGPVQPGTYHFAIGTAGATGLVLHTVYLPLALAGGPSTVTIEGGTHVKASPCFHFLEATWRRYMEQIGIHVKLRMHRPGFYPRGGGLLQADIAPCPAVSGLSIDSIAPVQEVRAVSAVAGLPEHIRERQADTAHVKLKSLGLDVELNRETWPGGPGTVVGVELPTQPVPTSFYAIGERGKPAERVATEAVDQVESFLAAEPWGVDEHSADQLVLPLALAQGPSSFPAAAVSSHLLTNVAVIQRFVERTIKVEGTLGREGSMRIE
jgi:RNA 3'-terminal phosphate cyclase (ATP)